ncbi:MAG TPA: tetratricopeptide repeat protein [Gemmatimonadales bacterium]|nr:tetratricopeptide repeat protein [Gemmatimonadales bacterium]
MNLEKLKDTARKLEQKEDWRKAIEVYLKAIQQAESGAETSPDLSLYNRVGDLYLKINDTGEAVRSYERAVDLYADQGFFNNAIALCGKILRVNPGRTQTYLKLCQLHARKNVVSEAKRNLIEFLERMNALGQLDQAFQAVKLFADQFSGSQEIRSMLVDLLRATSRGEEAREQLEKMAQDLEAAGDKSGARKTRERLQGIEVDHQAPPPAAAAPSSPRRGDLIFLDTGVDVPTSPNKGQAYARNAKEPTRPAPDPPPLSVQEPLPHEFPDPTTPEGLLGNEPQANAPTPLAGDLIIEPLVSGTTDIGADALLGIERMGDSVEPLPDLEAPLEIQRGAESSSLDFQPMSLEGMEGTSLGGGFVNHESASLDFTVEPERSPLDFPDDLIVSLPDTDTGFNLGTDMSTVIEPDPLDLSMPAGGLPLVVPEPRGNESLADLENRVLDDPENPDVHLALAEKLASIGETDRVAEELELALAGYEDRQDWARASEIATRLVKLAPDSIGHHQKRVELAYRTGDRGPLLEAYLGLGDALASSGALDKAAAVYGRVIEHDPGNARAAAALAKVGGSPAPAAPKSPPAKAAPPPKPETRASSKTPAPPASSSPKGPVQQPASAEPKGKPQPAAASVSGDDFVDLGSMLREEHTRRDRDTRMRVNRRDPQGQDEQREFHEILEQFKRGIDENLESDDYQSHYDLGVAFKEMGLLDEAIAEFQKALRAADGRLRTSEALGMAFFEKGQYAVCESVLRRAVEGLEGPDDAKIGLLYWLGRASEALGKKADAVASYERAVAVDIRFMDLSERIHRLTAGRRQ